MLLAIAVLLAGGALVYWLALRHQAPPRKDSRESKGPGRPFGGVEILFRGDACEAARALAGQRFLAKGAPSLPLPKCNASKCSCTFAKLADRRTDERRFEHGGLGAALYHEDDRRARRERRLGKRPPKRR